MQLYFNLKVFLLIYLIIIYYYLLFKLYFFNIKFNDLFKKKIIHFVIHCLLFTYFYIINNIMININYFILH